MKFKFIPQEENVCLERQMYVVDDEFALKIQMYGSQCECVEEVVLSLEVNFMPLEENLCYRR